MYNGERLLNTNITKYLNRGPFNLFVSRASVISWCSIGKSLTQRTIFSKLHSLEKQRLEFNLKDPTNKGSSDNFTGVLESEGTERTGHHFMKKYGHPTSVLGREYGFDSPIWNLDEVNSVKKTHLLPSGYKDKISLYFVSALRKSFDLLTGYKKGHNEYQWCRRIIFLETVAGVPGMVGAMLRHLNSLRKMKRDNGWIHTLLEEAENERMHLLISLQLINKPSMLTRISVIGAQFTFLLFYTMFYIISPKYSHRFVGYLEEEAVSTYTHLIEEIDKGLLPGFERKAPKFASIYYGLPEGATIRDLFLAMRRDESHHRDVNHNLADIRSN
ncbi:alternative oxidase [Cryptosporidium canis]|uniref:Alternative oxidase n=1 Tax=Cryptosporidium canis TaxID=195482 RepID=A0A9D5DG44_9CRYT|nr:alternative oxidase [Cryptosporidium canis]